MATKVTLNGEELVYSFDTNSWTGKGEYGKFMANVANAASIDPLGTPVSDPNPSATAAKILEKDLEAIILEIEIRKGIIPVTAVR